MAIELYQVKAALSLYDWVNEDPERAIETGAKLIGVGVVLIILSSLFSE